MENAWSQLKNTVSFLFSDTRQHNKKTNLVDPCTLTYFLKGSFGHTLPAIHHGCSKRLACPTHGISSFCQKITTKHHAHKLVHDPYPGDFRTAPCHILSFPATATEIEVIATLLHTASTWREKWIQLTNLYSGVHTVEILSLQQYSLDTDTLSHGYINAEQSNKSNFLTFHRHTHTCTHKPLSLPHPNMSFM